MPGRKTVGPRQPQPAQVPPPQPVQVPANWQHHQLFSRVREALLAAPAYFRSEVRIVGVPSTDIQNLNVLLGAAIEERVVDTLNGMRPVWDPTGAYALYSFVRQPQTFPDVLLRRPSDDDVIMGIELKGWYLLAKEEEPSFRFHATSGVCNPQDLIVVYPWHLSEIISGTPALIGPYIEHAKYVALYRNWHWEHGRTAAPNPVIISTVATPYPGKSANISDRATSDQGNNFGRIARTGLMEIFKDTVNARLLSGIPARHWRTFLKIFTQSANDASVRAALADLEAQVRSEAADDEQATDALFVKLRKIAKVL